MRTNTAFVFIGSVAALITAVGIGYQIGQFQANKGWGKCISSKKSQTSEGKCSIATKGRVANVPKVAAQKMAQMRADGMTLADILKEEGAKYGLKHQAEVSRVIKRTKIQIVETI